MVEPEYRTHLPVNGCAHDFVVWKVLKTTTRQVTVKIECLWDCRRKVTKTIDLV